MREAELRQEIAERERLLAAYQLIRADCEKSRAAPRETAERTEPEPGRYPEPAASTVLPASTR